MKILSSITTALGSVIHVVEAPFSEADKLGELFATVEKDVPEVKTAALQLVSLVEGVGADVATDLSEKGLNIPSDVKTFNDAAAVYSYVVTTLVPLFKQVYNDVKADLPGSTPAIAGAAAPEATAAQTGPGLHTIVPA